MKNRLFSTQPCKYVILTVLALIVCPIVEVCAKPKNPFFLHDFPLNLRENTPQIDDGYKEAIEGLKYNTGLGGIPIDQVRALELWRKAEQKKHPLGLYYVGVVYLNGSHGVNQDPNKSNEYLVKAFPGLEELAKKGDAASQNALGEYCLRLCEMSGVDKEKCYTKAVYWFSKAVEQNYPYAQFYLGTLYKNGTGAGNGGVEQNTEKAIELLTKAANKQLSQAEANLGVIYRNAKNFAKAKEYFERANSVQKLPMVTYSLGLMHFNGEGVPKDSKKAVEYFEEAGNQGSTDAQISIGRMYQEGLGIEKNLEKAKEWYKKAAAAGNTFAKEELQKMGVKD